MTGAPSPSYEIPQHLHGVFEKFFASEYAYFTPRGEPLCWPVSPYWYPERGVLAIATGLAYPNKAEYPKSNPKVALLFSDPIYSGLSTPPTVLVQGDATVVDEDIQKNTDRYVSEMRQKFPQARLGLNPLTVKFLDFYLPRLWVEITPVRISVWRELGGEPEVFGRAAADTPDLKPHSTSYKTVDIGVLADWVRRLGEAVVTVKGHDGYPSMVRTVVWIEDGERIALEKAPGTGPAALTFHYARLGGVRFNTQMARGWVEKLEDRFVFRTRRIVGLLGADEKRNSGLFAPALGNLVGSVFPFSAIPRIAELRRRLRVELARRGQPMPKLRVPR